MDEQWSEFCQRYVMMNEMEREKALASLTLEQREAFDRAYEAFLDSTEPPSETPAPPKKTSCVTTAVAIVFGLMVLGVVVQFFVGIFNGTDAPSQGPVRVVQSVSPEVAALMNGNLGDWSQASISDRSDAAVQMLRNVQSDRVKDYSGEQGRALLVAEATWLMAVMDETAQDTNLHGLSVSEIAGAGIILMDSQ